MNQATIRQLNQVNQNFYRQIGSDFDQTRQQPWSGWFQLLPAIRNLAEARSPVGVLDVGCGNGRFGQFLTQNLPATNFDYLGIDNDNQLLQFAQSRLPNFTFKKIDLVDSLLNNNLTAKLATQTSHFDLVVLMGVIHHIPSFDLRQQFIHHLSQRLNDGGLLLISVWQFALYKRFLQKAIACDKIGLVSSQLEKNDYILDWQRGQEAFRYCHFVDDQELTKLIDTDHLEVMTDFSADGSNRYLVLINHNNGNSRKL